MENEYYVKVWEEEVVFPTYKVGEPEKNPMFLEKRVYQGSSGVVYPNAVIESVEDTAVDEAYKAVFLENKYLKIMVLPELGGRIQMAYDKVKKRHFIYFNQVIKPALVGLTGPWISGGIEFNWPQHHRPSTFEPIDFKIEENKDGSKTVWVSEIERMFSTKGMAGFTLYPDSAYLEIKGVLYNRTQLPQTFLWWANPAVKVNDHYQSIFPPDVNAVFDHGKRDVSSFPIAKSIYYKVDYSPGTDISRYKNIPVPTSYMAVNSKYNFLGGYEHDTKAGILHVANRHLSPGKKQWTWGNGEFGYAWDRNLTDEDGPYIELMTGVFTDNQPDFSWIMPNEERRFTQYFMPYSELGNIKNASKDFAINLEVNGSECRLMAYSSSYQNGIIAELAMNGELLHSKDIEISPTQIFDESFRASITDNDELKFSLKDSSGKVLISYSPEKLESSEIPEAAKPALPPKEIESNEQLFLTGHHIEQYRHATFSAIDYYQEALKRDPKDSRCNNALGLWFYKRGNFTKARPYFEKAIETLTERNPNPYDSEAYYNLGLCSKRLGENDEAYTHFYKATWAGAWQDVAYLELARLSAMKHNYSEAAEHAQNSLLRNYRGHSARNVLITCLRKLGRNNESLELIRLSLEVDPLNMICYFEEYLNLKENDLKSADKSKQVFEKEMRGYAHNYLEYAFEYMASGFYHEAIRLLEIYIETAPVAYAMIHYVMAFLHHQIGDDIAKKHFLDEGEFSNPDLVFPNRLDEKVILEWVLTKKKDSNAAYFLGNFWYANRQYEEAIERWELSKELNSDFPTVHRNLSIAYFNKEKKHKKALESMKKAFELDTTDARVFMELDQLYKILNYDRESRFSCLTANKSLVEKRDDVFIEYLSILNLKGEYEEAETLMASRIFHPWEGGEGKVISQYLYNRIEQAKRALEASEAKKAIRFLEEAREYPHNLGEGKIFGTQENDIDFLSGLCYELLGDATNARNHFTRATKGLDEPVQAIFYNDQQPDKLLYQGLAWQKLDNEERAAEIFDKLIAFGESHKGDEIKIDYFAVSLPDLLVFDIDLNQRNIIHCQYMIGLGLLGLKKTEKALEVLEGVLKQNSYHQGAQAHLNLISLLAKPLAV